MHKDLALWKSPFKAHFLIYFHPIRSTNLKCWQCLHTKRSTPPPPNNNNTTLKTTPLYQYCHTHHQHDLLRCSTSPRPYFTFLSKKLSLELYRWVYNRQAKQATKSKHWTSVVMQKVDEEEEREVPIWAAYRYLNLHGLNYTMKSFTLYCNILILS